MLEAVDHYDPRRGDFETYARFRVRREIRNALTEQARLVRLPKHVVERRRALAKADARLTDEKNGRRTTVSELAADTGLAPMAVSETREAAVSIVSLDDPALSDSATRESAIPDGAAADPLIEAVEHERARLVRRAVARLPLRQRAIVVHRYGLDGPPQPMSEVAAELHLSPQRTSAIERDALSRLRTTLERDGVEP